MSMNGFASSKYLALAMRRTGRLIQGFWFPHPIGERRKFQGGPPYCIVREVPRTEALEWMAQAGIDIGQNVAELRYFYEVSVD